VYTENEYQDLIDKLANTQEAHAEAHDELVKLQRKFRVDSVYEEIMLEHFMKNISKFKISDLERVTSV
jgi:hypothetical protein